MKMPLRPLFLSLFLLATVSFAQESAYFPRIGSRSVAEQVREIKNPSVILTIAVCPGSEDLATIAQSRIGEGASSAVAFITNGEDIPSDLNGETFYLLAARRREEAYKALASLGVDAYFMSIPIDRFSAGGKQFRSSHMEDSLFTSRLDSIVDRVMPDVIVIDRDPLYGTAPSPRVEYAAKMVVADVVRRDAAPDRWHVARVLLESGGGKFSSEVRDDLVDPLWSETYSHMALTADRAYQSLRFHVPLWNANRRHSYSTIFPALRKAPIPFTMGLPALGENLESSSSFVKPVLAIGKVGKLDDRLDLLLRAIGWVDASIASHAGETDMVADRVLSTWKSDLERLRCTELGIVPNYSVSDTVLTQMQLFYLRFGKLRGNFKDRSLQVLFPGVIQKNWIVNERQNQFYPFQENDTFRVVSMRLPINSTESPAGFSAFQARTRFSFILFHHDSDPRRNFMYEAHIPFTIAPIRAIQVLTPQIAAIRDTLLFLRLVSNSRDTAQGIMYVHDPLVNAYPKGVELRGKNYVETDTLHLDWKDTSMTGARVVQILAGRNEPIGDFYARYMNVRMGSAKSVGIYSEIEDSPLRIALGRLGMKIVDMRKGESWTDSLKGISAIFVDQFSLAGLLKEGGAMKLLDSWVNSGGKLVIFPQYNKGPVKAIDGMDFSYSYLPVTGIKTPVVFDSTAALFRTPNEIKGPDLSGGQFPLAFGSVKVNGNAMTVIASGDGRGLLVEEKVGKGDIWYCSLNLNPRFLAVDETAYRLLANILGQ